MRTMISNVTPILVPPWHMQPIFLINDSSDDDYAPLHLCITAYFDEHNSL